MDVLTGLTLAAPAGVNAYIPLLMVAVCQAFGWIQLRAPFEFLGSWWMIAIIAVLLLVEIFADKIPAVDHVNDVIQTFVRPAAGGVLALSASGQGTVHPVLLALAGVVIAGGVHSVKAASRPAVNAVTGGTGAPVVSTIEDIGAFFMSALAIIAPILAALAIIGVIVAAFFAIKSWRERRAARSRPPDISAGAP